MAYLVGTQGMDSVSLSDATTPQLIDHLHLGGKGQSVSACGEPLCVAQTRTRYSLKTVDITDSADLQVIGGVHIPALSRSVAVKGRRWAYVANSARGVSIVDVSDPVSPTLVDRIDPGGLVTRVAVSGGRLYVASTLPKRVRIYEIADEQSPVYLGEVVPGSQVEALMVDGTTLHVSEYDLSGWRSILRWITCLAGFHCRPGDVVEAYDVSDPGAASPVGTYDAQETPAVHWKPYRQYGLVRTNNGFTVYRAVPVQ